MGYTAQAHLGDCILATIMAAASGPYATGAGGLARARRQPISIQCMPKFVLPAAATAAELPARGR
jgi:hypothetical protein